MRFSFRWIKWAPVTLWALKIISKVLAPEFFTSKNTKNYHKTILLYTTVILQVSSKVYYEKTQYAENAYWSAYSRSAGNWKKLFFTFVSLYLSMRQYFFEHVCLDNNSPTLAEREALQLMELEMNIRKIWQTFLTNFIPIYAQSNIYFALLRGLLWTLSSFAFQSCGCEEIWRWSTCRTTQLGYHTGANRNSDSQTAAETEPSEFTHG